MEQVGYTNSESSLDAIFAALADPTRRAILVRLTDGQASVKEIAAPFEMSQPAVSKHLKILEGLDKAPRGPAPKKVASPV